MGASPRSLAAEANGCFMVGIQHGSNRIQGRGASVARDGGLPSDLLDVSNRSKRLSETEEVRRSQEARWLDNQIPIQSRPWASLFGICRLSRGLVSIWRRGCFRFTQSARRARSLWRAN